MEGQCFFWWHIGQPDTRLHFATKQPPAESSVALLACPGPPLTCPCHFAADRRVGTLIKTVPLLTLDRRGLGTCSQRVC